MAATLLGLRTRSSLHVDKICVGDPAGLSRDPTDGQPTPGPAGQMDKNGQGRAPNFVHVDNMGRPGAHLG